MRAVAAARMVQEFDRHARAMADISGDIGRLPDVAATPAERYANLVSGIGELSVVPLGHLSSWGYTRTRRVNAEGTPLLVRFFLEQGPDTDGIGDVAAHWHRQEFDELPNDSFEVQRGRPEAFAVEYLSVYNLPARQPEHGLPPPDAQDVGSIALRNMALLEQTLQAVRIGH